MCKAIDDMRKESMAAGKLEGKTEMLNQNIKTMYKNGMNVDDIVKYLGLDLVFVKKVLAE